MVVSSSRDTVGHASTARSHDLGHVRLSDPMHHSIAILIDKVNIYHINRMLDFLDKWSDSCHYLTTITGRMGLIEHLSDAAATQGHARWWYTHADWTIPSGREHPQFGTYMV
jgi:hypothetical protein